MEKTHEAKKINDEIAAAIKAAIPAEKFLESFKAVGDEAGHFEIIISTNDVDRHGEIVAQDGIDVEQFLKNPVVLWAHDHSQLPVAICDKIYRKQLGSKEMTIAEGRFAPHAFAQDVRKMYEAGMLRTASIGFIPKEWDGNTITKSELIEFSMVPVPANPFAISLLTQNADKLCVKDLGEMIAKGLMIKEVEAAAAEEEKPAGATTEVGEPAAPVQETEEEKKIKALEIENANLKSGRVLSKANEQKLKSAISVLEEIVASLGEENSGAPENTKANDDDVEKAEEFLKLRRNVQGIATALQDALHVAGKDAEKLYKSSN